MKGHNLVLSQMFSNYHQVSGQLKALIPLSVENI